MDKKGILSWPNPTAEKVFFLRDGDTVQPSAAKASTAHASATPHVAPPKLDNDNDDRRLHANRLNAPGAAAPIAVLSSQTSMDSDTSQAPGHGGQHPHKSKTIPNDGGGAIAEVLDLTHDQHSPFRLAFDDHAWSAHLQSLKPLGLAILVNTCCPLTQAHYAQFCNHVTAVAMLDKDLVPVTNRYEIVESRLNSFMHGYVMRDFRVLFFPCVVFLFSFRRCSSRLCTIMVPFGLWAICFAVSRWRVLSMSCILCVFIVSSALFLVLWSSPNVSHRYD